MPRLSFMGLMDYANAMTNWRTAINQHASSLEARCFTLLDHPFDYSNKRDWCSGSPIFANIKRIDRKDPDLLKAIDWFNSSDIVVWAPEMKEGHRAQSKLFRKIGFHVSFRDASKTYLVYHCGTIYRNNSLFFNREDHPFALRLLGPDNALLAGDDPRVRIARNCYPEVPETTPPRDRLHVNHTPSDPARMGTAVIRQAVNRVKQRGISFDYEQTFPPLPHEDIMSLFRRSHIHIDQVQTTGIMGMTAVEAAASGNAVVCTSHKMGLLKRSLDSWPIIDPGLSVESVEDTLVELLSQPREELERMMHVTREWLYRNFGYETLAKWWESTVAEV